ncbi:MAG: endonuclease/exonuclease/phosphatase family protein [Clostridiales bacterium]|nr:endonuclease/exonuclease/phosphatase family protein [Clostridiales bacterium]
MNKTLKTILKAVLGVLIALVVVALGYLVYVFADYYRLDDNIKLEVSGNVTDKANAEKEFSIMTWNIGFGAYSDDYTFFMDGGKESRAFSKEAAIDNTEAMAKRMEEENPDFIIIQEIDTNATRSYHVDEREIIKPHIKNYNTDFAQNYDSPYLFYPIFRPHGKSVAGIMTCSKYKMENAVRRSLPIETGFTKFLDLDRCYSVSEVPLSNGKILYIYNMHLSAYTSDGTIANEQLKMLVDDMKEKYDAGNYIVCGGDFNKDVLGDSSKVFGIENPGYTWAQPIPDGIIPGWLSVVTGSNAPSCRNPDKPYDETNFVLTVDGFIISDNVEMTNVEVLNERFAHSDHNPVKMTFKLK